MRMARAAIASGGIVVAVVRPDAGDQWIACSAAATSTAVANRCSRSRARQHSTTSERAGERAGARARGSGGGISRRAISVAANVSPLHVGAPVSNS